MAGCIGNEGEYILGTAKGWLKGDVAAVTSSGAQCTGSWFYGSGSKPGQLGVVCDDGRAGVARISYYHKNTMISISKGMLDDETTFIVWSGPEIARFIRLDKSDPNARLQCADVVVPLPE